MQGRVVFVLIFVALGSGAVFSCVGAYRKSVGADEKRVVDRVYLTQYETAWAAVLDAVKSMRLDVSNRDAGLIQTQWTDNTEEKNFADGLTRVPVYFRAKYRLRINLIKGFFDGSPSIKVSVLREQLVQRDMLEDWIPYESDLVQERTLLYRVGRLISMKNRIENEERRRTEEELKATEFEGPESTPSSAPLAPLGE